MRQQISVQIINKRMDKTIFKDTNLMEFTDKTTIAELIPEIKKLVPMPLNNIESEKFYLCNDEMKLTDVVPNTTGCELEIYIK